MSHNNQERLQKVLAQAGVASRRASEALITAGRVKVNGQVVTQLGIKVDPFQDKISVDGQPLSKRKEKPVYIILNKPRKILTATHDNRGRQTVLDLVDVSERIYPVGRLDLHSEGLILLTNDGSLTTKLTHPKYQVEKEYEVLVVGKPTTATLIEWRKGGIEVEGKPVAPAIVKKMKEEGSDTWLKIILTEGRKREIREVARTLNHTVKKLTRVRLGPLKLGRLKAGKWRHLNEQEIQRLKQLVKE
ncbi:MAG: pseudouridine synthase [Chloroflexota bacterium]